MSFASSVPRYHHAIMAGVAILGVLCASRAPAQQNAVLAPVATVNDATFRSRWSGPQVDQSDALSLVPTSEGIRPVEDFATKLREGLHIGSMRFRPGLSVGWDYTDRNYEGQDTTSLENNQSFFVAPSMGVEFARDTGPWSLMARYGGGYTYYLNPDYSPNGTGSSRNPFFNTGAIGIGHSGMRHSAEFGGSASYGNGENIQANGDTTTFTGGATLSYSYMINEFVTAGAYARYDTQITRYEVDTETGSDLNTVRGGAYVDWLCTGKTTAGLKAEAGRMSSQITQNVLVAAPAPSPTPGPAPGASPAPAPTPTPAPTYAEVQQQSEVQTRQFGQLLAVSAHNLTAKILVVGGLGASYTADENIDNVDPKYTGVRPVYLFGVQFDPSEKTGMRFYTSFEGADVVPSYGLSLTWRPRINTALTLSAYQNQNFSITSTSQFQVNRGFVLGIQQILFSKLSVGVSGGWQQTEQVSLSADAQASDPTEYAFVSGSLSWRLNSWASWVTSVRASSGNQSDPVSLTSFPETTASVGLNLIF